MRIIAEALTLVGGHMILMMIVQMIIIRCIFGGRDLLEDPIFAEGGEGKMDEA